MILEYKEALDVRYTCANMDYTSSTFSKWNTFHGVGSYDTGFHAYLAWYMSLIAGSGMGRYLYICNTSKIQDVF